MERKKVIVELTVLTQRFQDRDIERDIDALILPLRRKESGQTEIEDVDIKSIR